ncbi:MAG: transcriptional regulator GcvA [Aquincola sp.]|nr:transcriptional regulator GcvA [Aquincola sp.]
MRLKALPSLDLLRTFEASARHLSFTKAAEELFVTPSAVSRQIKMLEESLGVSLYLRGVRSLSLTEAGRRLQRTVDAALHQLEASFDTLKGTVRPRVLAIGTTVSFAALWLVPRLAEFRRRHPEVDIRVSAANDVQDVRRERLDVAIRYARPERLPQGTRVLFQESVFPVCSPGLQQDPARPLSTPADLAQHVLLHMDDACGDLAWYRWNHWLDAQGLGQAGLASALRFSHYDQMIQAAVDGQGVALGRHPLVDRLLAQGRLVAPIHQPPTSSGTYYLVVNTDTQANPDAELFVAWLLELALAEPAA